MTLGFGLISGQIAPGERSWASVYSDAIALAVRAEEKGFDSVWTTEHHFVDDGYMPSLLVVSAALAQATSTIRIGTGVILAPLYHPLRLAEDAATVQLISGGRLDLGLGLGWSAMEFEALGMDIRQRGRAMDEILQILPQAWTGDPFRWDGDVYSFPEVGVRPAPSEKIPVIVGGTVDAAVRRAARFADGFFSNASPDRFVHQVEVATEELERVGRNPSDFSWIYYAAIFPTEDPETALPHLWHQRWKYADMEASASRRLPAADTPPLDETTKARVLRASLTGGPDQIVEALHTIRDRVGVPVRFMARSHFATLNTSAQTELLDTLAENVLPFV